MLFFFVCLLLYCNIFSLTGKPITLIIITSSGSVILMTTVAEILQGQILNSVNQTKQPSHVQLLLRYTWWNCKFQTHLWVLLFLQMWNKLYVQSNCAILQKFLLKNPVKNRYLPKHTYNDLFYNKDLQLYLWYFEVVQNHCSGSMHLLNP